MDSSNDNNNTAAAANGDGSTDPLTSRSSSRNNSAPNSGGITLQLTDNKYAHLDDSQLEEFAKIVSPKVSDLLHEQALVLDDLLDTSAWSSDNDDDDDSQNRRGSKKKNKRGSVGDDDSMNDEWDQLEQAQMNLRDELDAANFDMMYNNRNDGDYSDNDTGEEEIAGSNSNKYNEEWNDSIHQYYKNNTTQSAPATPTYDTARFHNINTPQHSFPVANPNHSYTLADHARTLDISRSDSNRGLYTKPFLSRNEIETSTLDILTLPRCITHPNDGQVSSRTREQYMKHILDCMVEYIEPPKAKIIKRLFSGWQPGPGESKSNDEQHRAMRNGGEDSQQRVTSYSPAKADIDNDDSSDDDDGDSDNDNNNNDDGNFPHFQDVDGMLYSQPNQVMEPLPIRTVTIRIRCDVLCGAVMDATTTSVERLGGEITKRQGGHLRAVIPGRKMSVNPLGTRERAREILDEIDAVVHDTNNEDDSSHDYEVVNNSPGGHNSPGHDGSSMTSGISNMLSPILGGSSSTPISQSKLGKGRTCEILPPYILDAQLVTKRVGKECQRLILMRIYRMQDVARAQTGMMGEEECEAFDIIAKIDTKGELHSREPATGGNHKQQYKASLAAINPLMESKRSLQMSIEASALVQRIKAVGGFGFAINPQPITDGDDTASVSSFASTKSYLKSFGDAITSPIRYFGTVAEEESEEASSIQPSSPTPQPTVMELMTRNILRKLIPSPSVGVGSKSELAVAKQRSHGIYPALSRDDQPYIKSSWMFLRNVIEELDQRCLAYSTLGNCPLFHAPALPTIDVHFIAQVKAFCRESMIVSLIKTASDLEVFARESEVSCGNVDTLLRPTFEVYKLQPPQLPNPLPLTAYPLDFTAPEEISPPWGHDVMSALEKITNEFIDNPMKKSDPLASVECSEKAVSMIVLAFQKQNDVEMGARLGRKNMQVMDRLAKMQAHRRNSITKIRDSYGTSLLATKAGDEFHTLRQKASNVGSLTDVINAIPDEVPLLICNVLVGNAAGTCYVTYSHILFNTQLLPILGGNKVHLFSIMDVEVTINAPSKSVLSPLPASISFTTAVFGKKSTTREEIYNFIPSIGARRFAKFLEVIRGMKLEDPNSLKFSDKGGLIYDLAD